VSRERQQKTNEYFIKNLGEEVAAWCELNKIPEGPEAFLAYMVRHNFLRQSVINQYVATKAYKEKREEAASKEQAVWALCELLPLEERQIWNLLSNHYIKFTKPNKFKFP
jgi:hypothetical protein